MKTEREGMNSGARAENSRASIAGSVERVTYHNADTGYCVLRIKAREHGDLVTLVGYVSTVSPGEFIEASGEWTQHRDFGLQFKATFLKTVHPSTLEGMERYLGSGMVKGIGPHFAKKLVEAFAFEVFEVIEKTPEALRRVEGIGPVRVQKIARAWQEQKVVREIMVFLQSYGVSTSKAVRIYKTYGQDAVARVSSNPYQLARDIHGIGFKSADLIAERLGISKTSLIRAQAGIHYVLMERVAEGHCAYPEEQLLKESAELLTIERGILEKALALEIVGQHLRRENIGEEICIYPSSVHHFECEVARLLRRLRHGRVPWGDLDTERALSWVDKRLAFELAPLQREAVKQALTSKVLVITGGPGTGKTTLTRSIVSILQAKNVEIVLCSPTGRAAKRLAECTGRGAKTIHRLLGVSAATGKFQHDQDNPLPLKLLLLDEASMVDVSLMFHLLKAIPSDAALIIVGDVDQLPSVGPGSVLQAIIDSNTIPVVKLTHIFRQSAQSDIVNNAHLINQGRMPDLEYKGKQSDFCFISSEDPEKTSRTIIDLVKHRIPSAFGFDPVRDIQVLCPMNRGILGGRALNVELQRELNPDPSVKIERFGFSFAPGDKVMVTANDYDKEVFNGDIGFIKAIDPIESETTIDFDGRDVVFDFNEMDIVVLAYATSIHKSQGSEYPVVVIPIATQHYVMLKRNLVYTGITRGKKLVVVIGQKRALAIAIKSKNQGKRWNKLAERLSVGRSEI